MFDRPALFVIATALFATTTTTNAFVVPTPLSCPATSSTTALASSLETSSQQRRSLDERMAALERGSRGAAAYSNIEAERMRHLDTSSTAELQGEGAIKTWSFDDPGLETVDVRLFNEGLPLEAVLDLWQGPSHTPTQAIIYSEDGNQHPLTAKILLMQQRNHGSHTVGIRNTAPMTFPCTADVGATSRADDSILRLLHAPEEVVQGGALHTFTLDPYVDRVRVLIKNDVFGDGRPLHARIELLQGPNNKKQVLEVYTDDGPFYCEMETPGSGYVVRVVNISPIEFPLGAVVETYGEGMNRNGYGNRGGYNSYNNNRGGGSYYDNDNRYASSDRSRYDVRNGRGGSYYGSAGARNSYGNRGGYGNTGYGNNNSRYGGNTYGDNYYGNNNRLGGYGNYGNSLYNGNRNQGYGYGNSYGGYGNNSYNRGGYGGGGGYNRYNNGGYGYNNNRGYGGGYNNNRGYGGYGVGYNNNNYGGYNNNRNSGNFANRFMRNNNDVLRDGNYNRRWYD